MYHTQNAESSTSLSNVFVFHDPTKKSKVNKMLSEKTTLKSDNAPGIDLRQARYEVQKFGSKGLATKDKEEMRLEMLVKLGAKPPRNKYMNYKKLLEMKQLEKRELLEKQVADSISHSGKKKRLRKVLSSRSDIATVDGQLGRYKKGVQVVRKQDLQVMKHRDRRTSARRDRKTSKNRHQQQR